MSKLLIILYFLILVSCSDKHELIVEYENEINEKFYVNINGSISFPRKRFNREIDIHKDKIEVIKIKYTPINNKWPVNNSNDCSFGQAALFVRIIRKGNFYESDEVIYDGVIINFYNPEIFTRPSSELTKIKLINEDLDSGVGNGTIDNSLDWLKMNNPNYPLNYFSNDSRNFYHSLIYKITSRQTINYEFGNNPIVIDANNPKILVESEDEASALAKSDISKCVVLFPFDSLRLVELQNFLQ